MKREVLREDLERLYDLNDMVRADSQGCTGCHACCQGMGDSVVLDPYDAWRLSRGLSQPFGEIMKAHGSFHVEEGVILPNLKMEGEAETCTFLNEAGRCRIHPFRPGLCRLFPLGRIYEGHGFRYYLQSSQCPRKERSKVKVKKWIDTPEITKNEAFILCWHQFLKELSGYLKKTKEEKLQTDVNTYMLHTFYLEPYELDTDFYSQFEARLTKMKKLLDTINWA